MLDIYIEGKKVCLFFFVPWRVFDPPLTTKILGALGCLFSPANGWCIYIY